MVPPFNEEDVDLFFKLFERVAETQGWTDSDRALLLQCVLTGKAQRAYSALSVEDSRKYETVKTSVLRAFELIPESYRIRFRKLRKQSGQTHVEFARDLRLQCQRWCASLDVKTFDKIFDLIVLEQYKNTLSERLAIYVAEKHVVNEAEAAVLADEYELTHKVHSGERMRSEWDEKGGYLIRANGPNVAPGSASGERRVGNEQVCRYCLEKGHWKVNCPVLKSKAKLCYPPAKPTALAVSAPTLDIRAGSFAAPNQNGPNYYPFISDGFVSLIGSAEKIPVKILRDTGASESFILESLLPFSSKSSTGKSRLVRGIDLRTFEVPLHRVFLFSELVQGEVELGVRSALPVCGVSVILGNNLAGGRVWQNIPAPE